jgi:hypothetical protein
LISRLVESLTGACAVMAGADVGEDDCEWLLQPATVPPVSVVATVTPAITVRGILIAPCSLPARLSKRSFCVTR